MDPLDTHERQTLTAVTLAYSEYGKPPAPAALPIVTLSPKERMVRALKRLFLVWALAAASIVLPVLHFCLPPLLAVAGLVAAALAFSATVRLDAHAGLTCPNCQKPIALAGPRFGWPVRYPCTSCGAAIRAMPERQP